MQILGISGILAFGKFFKRLTGSKEKPGSISLTSITLKFGADVHAIAGREITEQVFSLDIPFQNKIGSGLLPDNLKGPEVKINEILVEKPFELVSASPETPISLPFLSNTVFKLRIRAPMQNYSGPLSITFATDSKDNVNIDVNKVTLIDGERRVDVEETAANMILKKSQIVRRDIQVYKILKYGRTVEKMEINTPFEIVSADPPAPFTVDRKDSYIIKVYIKCPDFNYAGPMEISFK
jgi:hypothetical protein